MTVFFGIDSDEEPHFSSVSDALITTADLKLYDADSVPTRFGLGADGTRSRAVRCMSKCFLGENYCIHWAGNVANAKKAISILRRELPNNPSCFQSTLNNMSPLELNSIQLLASIINRERFESFSWNVPSFQLGAAIIYVGGSGSYTYFEDLEAREGQSKPGIAFQGKSPFEIAMNRLASLLDHERFDPASNILDWGGAYELVAIDRGKFRRIPYFFLEVDLGDLELSVDPIAYRRIFVYPHTAGSVVEVSSYNAERCEEREVFARYFIPEIFREADMMDASGISPSKASDGIIRISFREGRHTIYGRDFGYVERMVTGGKLMTEWNLDRDSISKFIQEKIGALPDLDRA